MCFLPPLINLTRWKSGYRRVHNPQGNEEQSLTLSLNKFLPCLQISLTERSRRDLSNETALRDMAAAVDATHHPGRYYDSKRVAPKAGAVDCCVTKTLEETEDDLPRVVTTSS